MKHKNKYSNRKEKDRYLRRSKVWVEIYKVFVGMLWIALILIILIGIRVVLDYNSSFKEGFFLFIFIVFVLSQWLKSKAEEGEEALRNILTINEVLSNLSTQESIDLRQYNINCVLEKKYGKEKVKTLLESEIQEIRDRS